MNIVNENARIERFYEGLNGLARGAFSSGTSRTSLKRALDACRCVLSDVLPGGGGGYLAQLRYRGL